MYSEVKKNVLNAMAEVPKEIQELGGEVFFSGLSALKKGDFYLAGLNPGEGAAYLTIKKHVEDWTLENFSAYVHQCWNDDCWSKDCYGMQENLACKCVRGDSKHQRGVRRIFARCGELSPQDVFATQAVFVKSHSAANFRGDSKLKMREVFEAGWPLHRHFLSVVQPKVIICLGYQEGDSSFSFFRSKAAPVSDIREYKRTKTDGTLERYARFKSLNVKFHDPSIPGEPLVVGIFHPSYLEYWADIPEFQNLIEGELAKYNSSVE